MAVRCHLSMRGTHALAAKDFRVWWGDGIGPTTNHSDWICSIGQEEIDTLNEKSTGHPYLM